MNLPSLYTTLAPWWPLLSSPADYAEEAAAYWDFIRSATRRPITTALELGCGGGNLASHLTRLAGPDVRFTLTDLSPAMLDVSRRLNPRCEHIPGDMRTLRLNRAFDAVLIHDAIMYMRTEADLAAAIRTAFEHTAPGGAALFIPDCTRETWRPSTDCGGHDERVEDRRDACATSPSGACRGLRYLEWTYDPDPADTEFTVDFAFLLREADESVTVHRDRHIYGLFPRATWLRVIAEAGFDAAARENPAAELQGRQVFVGSRRT